MSIYLANDISNPPPLVDVLSLLSLYLADDVCQAGERQSSGIFGFVPLKLAHVSHQVHCEKHTNEVMA